mmetsp:Transcript_3936/g.4267  ORF Transcript_3936/g.4267 Transcript_3936/m.4267 type:complete len:139 (-) Transcript_3936:229-645(-)
MKMVLSPRPVQQSTTTEHEAGIECKVLGNHHQQLVVKVIVPTGPLPVTTTHNNGRGQQGVGFPGAAKSCVTDSKNLDGGFASKTEMDLKDSVFRQESEKNDAAFLKRLTDTDKAFRAKITTTNEIGIETGTYCLLDVL